MIINPEFKLDLRKPIDINENFIDFMINGYMFSGILFSSVELNIFNYIEEGPKTITTLAKCIEVEESVLERLLVYLISIKLIDKGEHELYYNSAIATKLFTENSSENIIPVVLHNKNHIYSLFTDLTKTLKEGSPNLNNWKFSADDPQKIEEEIYSELSQHETELHIFLRAMNIFSKNAGTVISQQVDLNNIHTMIDLGGGGGQVSLEIAKSYPHLQIKLIDLEETNSFTRKYLHDSGVSSQIECMDGDFLSYKTDEKVDCVLISAVLGDWNKEIQHKIIRQAYNLLKPNGLLLISETLLDNNKKGPVLPALLSLYVFSCTKGGKNLTYNEVEKLLLNNRFGKVNLFDNRDKNVRDLIIARKL
jgi:predicted O-methyltransferase YrrM/predicted transcriptional regulator